MAEPWGIAGHKAEEIRGTLVAEREGGGGGALVEGEGGLLFVENLKGSSSSIYSMYM